MPWPTEWNRESIRRDLEDATGRGLSVDDPLPDTLLATAQSLDLKPAELRVWIGDGKPKLPEEWNAATLTRWAERYGIGKFAQTAPPEVES